MMQKQGISGKMRYSGSVKVLLCEDITELGWLGDVVEVNAGYARNYLLPQGLAVIPTEANLRSLVDEKARRAEQRKLDIERLKKIAAAVEGAEVVIATKANKQGVLFGSVGKEEIAKNLREQGFEVADEMVQLPEKIKQVGSYSITVKFGPDLTAAVNVVVVAAGADVESLKEPEQQSNKQQENQKWESS
ncbi:MAG: 50S ribosomal protein L9 [Planctomycetota bacterium]|nr:MAG: 50S ribosomal protein L9 [Planctomycetota bacterium]